MAYRIQYGQTMHKETLFEGAKTKNGRPLYRWIAVAGILLALTLLSHMGHLDFLIPGNKAVTKEAFASMVEDVGNGVGVETALTTFCREIIDSAEKPC